MNFLHRLFCQQQFSLRSFHVREVQNIRMVCVKCGHVGKGYCGLAILGKYPFKKVGFTHTSVPVHLLPRDYSMDKLRWEWLYALRR